MKTKDNAKRTKTGFVDPLADRLNIPRPVVALATDYFDGHDIPFHQHYRSQLIHAVSGVMTVDTEGGMWVIPPGRAVWVPACLRHRVSATGELRMRSLFLDPDVVTGLPDNCSVVSVPPLLRELILRAVAMPPLYLQGSPDERIVQVILDCLHGGFEVNPLNLPIPRDSRLLRIFSMMTADPGDNRTLAAWGKTVGAASRTLARLFRTETGMTFHVWRQQLRILEALKGLAVREPVTSVALRMGYNSPSAFISMFRRTLWKTPGDYFG
ncbi:MAG: helix-turn-helix transcriptional regulator [Syntrophales bacterium]|nr:helix-turn-helix transcriptional regulator [Syntrophales bacterium]